MNELKPLNLKNTEEEIRKQFKVVFEQMKKEMNWDTNFEDFTKDERKIKEDVEEIRSTEIDYEYSLLLGMWYMLIKVKQRVKSAVQGLKKDIVEMQFEQDEDANIYISFTKGKIIELIKKWFPNMIENETKTS